MRRVLLAAIELLEAVIVMTLVALAGSFSVAAFVVILPFALIGDAWAKR